MLLLLARSLANTDETLNTDEFMLSSAFRPTLQASKPRSPTPSHSPSPTPGGLDPMQLILVVMLSIILVTILAVMAVYCHRRMKRRDTEDERVDEPLLIPSDEF
jgi:hypothetical protein